MRVGFALPAIVAGSANNFTANLAAYDQAKGEYLCVDVYYSLA
jgi:hypothetical protein